MPRLQLQNRAGGRPMNGFIFTEEESDMRWKIGYIDCHCGASLAVTVPLETIMELGAYARKVQHQEPIMIKIGTLIERFGKKLATNG